MFNSSNSSYNKSSSKQNGLRKKSIPSFKSPQNPIPSFKSPQNPIPSFKSPPPPIPSFKLPPPPIQQPSTKSTNGGLFSSVMDGFSFGVGSSIAHKVIGGIFDSSSTSTSTKVETQKESQKSEANVLTPLDISKPEYISKSECKIFQEKYLECIGTHNSNTNYEYVCSFSLNEFKNCESKH
jgi:hypothetical protein